MVGVASAQRPPMGSAWGRKLMSSGLASLDDLKMDPGVAPGWGPREVRRRRAMLIRVDETTVWVAAVVPSDISVIDDLRWLTNRRQVVVVPVSEETLLSALAKTL